MKATLALTVLMLGLGAVSTPASTPAARASAQQDSVAALFQAYLASEAALRQVPGAMDLGWDAIPDLLELANDETILDTRDRTFGRFYVTEVLTTPPPATGQAQALTGMIALWLLEGIRCGAGESFRPPLYAFCTSADRAQPECEVARDLHAQAIAAYQKWWNTVQNKSRADAVAADPLAGTGLHWCGPLQPVLPSGTTQPEPPTETETAVEADPVAGLPEPRLTIADVAAYHHQSTGQYLSTEKLKRLYTGIAIRNYSKRGDASMKDAARRALAFAQDLPTRLQLYVRLSDGYYLQEGKPWPETRKTFSRVLFVGLREVLAQSLPDAPPELPAVGRFSDVGSGPEADAIRATLEAEHAAQMAARAEAERIRTLVDYRNLFTRKLVSEYGYRERTPEALDELYAVAREYLGDEHAARQLRDAAAAYTGRPNEAMPILRIR